MYCLGLLYINVINRDRNATNRWTVIAYSTIHLKCNTIKISGTAQMQLELLELIH